jgi:hypothetical protein
VVGNITTINMEARQRNKHKFEILRVLEKYWCMYDQIWKKYKILHNKIIHRFPLTTHVFIGWKNLIADIYRNVRLRQIISQNKKLQLQKRFTEYVCGLLSKCSESGD